MMHLDVFGLIKAAQMIEQKLSVALFYSGLRIPQYRLLEYIEEEGSVTVSDISRRFDTTRATASQLVNELIGKDIVSAIENPEDRRSFFIKLTSIGRNKLAVGHRDLELVLTNISSKYSEDTIKILNDFARERKWSD
jgi:DNA-binding MarR family transcriptional regulator